jgi:LacI family transcriptional regulator, gluconate utilization system Gnt-I transcriptional repressor
MLATYMRKRTPRRTTRKQHPTLEDVAEMVGVSPSTVSRAMSNPMRVSKKTRERIEAAVAKIGFVPNLLAGGLAANRNNIIVFVVPTLSLMMFNESVQLIVSELTAAGYRTLLMYGRRPRHEMDKVILDVVSLRPDGVILMGADLSDEARERLVRRRVPVVEVWDMPDDPIDMVAGFSHKQVGRNIGEYLLRRGYERPLLVWGTGARAMTMGNALSYVYVQSGREAPVMRPCKFPPDFTDGREAMRESLAMPAGKRPDVIACLSDWAAHGALIEARHLNKRVPQDIAVTGFGDLDFASQLEPPLTTVRINQPQLARAATECLLQTLNGSVPANRVVNVEATLVERASA